ncbi:Hsp70 family protein [Cryptosporangium minutisporangium]|uniref:Hsp70 family protein n=1 Tax=Cryptosporangium minutisporangium TaxID=113569 RepID=UPI0031EF70DE
MRGTTLAIDYGTSNTVAMLRWPDRRTRPLLFDGSPLLPSAVFLEPGGALRAGRDAVRSARLQPACYEPNPKRRVDEGTLLLGEHEVPIVAAVAATLRMVRDEAHRTANEFPESVIITCPVAWGASRQAVLIEASAQAGLPTPQLVPEPVAAAAYFVGVLGSRITDDQSVVTYDLGAGTFDVSVVRRGRSGFETLAYQGLDDLGGLDLDALVVDQINTALEATPTWQQLIHPDSLVERRAFRQLWDDACGAKEALSRNSSAEVPIPLLDRDVHVTREAFDAAARPMLERSVAVTDSAIRASGVPKDRIGGVFLVGGSTRVPLVATLLHQRLGIAPTVLDHPELVVAEGALHAVVQRTSADAEPVATGAASRNERAESAKPERALPTSAVEVGPAGITIESRPWLVALRGLALSAVGGVVALLAVITIGATLFALPVRYEYLSDPGGGVLFVGVGVFECGIRVLARAFDKAELGIDHDHLIVRLVPRLGHLLVRLVGHLLVGGAFAAALFAVIWNGMSTGGAWAVAIACGAGLALSLAAAAGEIVRWSRRRRRFLLIDTAASAASAEAKLDWQTLTAAEIRPFGWRQSRTLFVALKPGVEPPALLRPVRSSEALRVMDLGAYSMPVTRVADAVQAGLAERLSVPSPSGGRRR